MEAQTGPLAPGEIVITEFFDDFFRVDPANGGLTPVADTGFGFGSELGIDPQNRIIGTQRAADSLETEVVRYDPASGLLTTLTPQLFSSVGDLAVEPDGSVLLIEDSNLLRIDTVTGSVSTLVDSSLINGGFFSPSEVAVGGNGRIFVTDFFEDLYEINSVTGVALEVPIANNGLNPAGPFGVRPEGGLIVEEDGSLFNLDPDTGAFSLFASGLPTSTSDIAIDDNGNIFVAANEGLFRIDAGGGSPEPLTGDISFFNPDEIVVAGTFVHDTAPPTLLGDFAGDGFVGQSDLDLVLLNFGDTELAEGFNAAALPGGAFDGLIGQDELDAVLLNFGLSANELTAVPEPATAAWLFLAAGALAARRRQG